MIQAWLGKYFECHKTPNGKTQIKYTQVGLYEVCSTKIFILDSHINPLTYNLFLNQGREIQTEIPIKSKNSINLVI